MRLATVHSNGSEKLAVCTHRGPILMERINRELHLDWPEQMDELLQNELFFELNTWYASEGNARIESRLQSAVQIQPVSYAPLYRRPPKIWGIGLNYAAHARDLAESQPANMPASFMKPRTAIIGHGDTIHIPLLSQKTTAEAELGIVIGKRCRHMARENWLDAVAGFTPIIDVTAEDILRQNPRYLTLSKSFDTFFAFGPQLVTPDEIADLYQLKVQTRLNGRAHAENLVQHMRFLPDQLVSFHSQVMTLLPGDIISSGTPGAVAINHGDEITCTISGFEALTNRVVDLKRQAPTA
jgi:2-keto-4-pentenoate hydratase/2-oxohepta-3-ene-1,7-dioic acid hydratase in catechol pathway